MFEGLRPKGDHLMRRIAHFRPSPAMVVAIIALLVALGGVAAASIPGKGGVINACYLKTGGSLRVFDTSKPGASGRCHQNERTLTWNRQGPQGIRGQQGIQGVKGNTGAPGPTEGTSADFFSDTTPPSNVAVDATRDASPFTTTQSGHVFVSKFIAGISATCTGETTVRFVLVVDGARVPGSFVDTVPNGTTVSNVTLTGVTPTVLAAGQHTASIGIACGGTGVTNTSTDVGQGVTAVVLG